MRRGRKPIPTSLHKLRGTYNATRHGRGRKDEPVAHGELGAAPAWLSASQKAGWQYALAHAPAGVLKAIDGSLLAVWVVTEDTFRIAAIGQAQIDRGNTLPLLTRDRNGLPVASPYLGIMHKAANLLLKAAAELGFTPAARPRLGAKSEPTPGVSSPWDRFEVIDGGKT